MPDNRPSSPALTGVSPELIADLLGRILAEHWLQRLRRNRERHRDNPEQTHQNPNVGQTLWPVE